MAQYGWILWVVVMIVFAGVEAATVNLVSVWFVGGALAALVAQLVGSSLLAQVLVFLAVSAILLGCLRPFVRKYVSPKKVATNADSVLGQEAYLTEAVDNLRETGALKLGGKVWSVRSETGEVLPQGTLVRVLRLEGVRLYVAPVSVRTDP